MLRGTARRVGQGSGENERAQRATHRGAGGGLAGVLGACRGIAGEVQDPWQCHWHARITQAPRVGELEPKTVFLAVSGQFHDLVKRRKN